jgi:hypothetical protein
MPGRQGKNNLSTSSGGLSSETSILFHSNSCHTTNSETLLQQQIKGHQPMQQQQSTQQRTMNTIKQQLLMDRILATTTGMDFRCLFSPHN